MKKTNLTILVFTLMNFVLAMTAFVFGGILDKVAVSLNVSVADSGLLNTMYSYGAAFGVPITLIVFRKIERTKLLKTMLFVTILTTLALVLTQYFTQLLIIRLVMGISANSYGILAISMVIALATTENQGRSLAFLIAGNSLALVIGVPLTRVLSAVFDWRSIFWMLNIIMIFSLAYFAKFLPAGNHESTKLDLKNELNFFKDGKTLLVMAYSLVMFVGYGAFFYLRYTLSAAAFPVSRSDDEHHSGSVGTCQFHRKLARRSRLGSHRVCKVFVDWGGASNRNPAANFCVPFRGMVECGLFHPVVDERLVHGLATQHGHRAGDAEQIQFHDQR